MQSVALPDKCRRRNRSSLHREAVGHQLNHVAETLQLDAIVLADDLGRPLAHAGDPQLASMLAELALWSAPAADELDEATSRASAPCIRIWRTATWWPSASL